MVVAASGGADSMSLLAVLHQVGPRPAAGVSAAHFDHGLRAESRSEGDLVEAFCRARGIAFRRGCGDVRARARSHRESIEKAAREMRYAFLERAARELGAERIATAHTRDDQVETILMRVLRGAGVRGLAGIPRRRGPIVRPLLGVTGAQTRAYCRQHGIEFADDPTNADTRYARNWVRHDVLPAMRRAAPGIDDDLLRLGDAARDALSVIRSETDPVLDAALEREGNAWVLDTRALAGLDDLSRYVLLADLLAHRAGLDCDAGRVHFERLVAMTRRGARSGGMASLPGACARREHDALVFYPGSRRPPDHDGRAGACALPVPGSARVGEYRLVAEIVPRGRINGADLRRAAQSGGGLEPGVAYFARDSLLPPLVVRAPRRGDRMRPFGMRGRRKLSDVFIDRKIPARRRPHSLVVEDGREIVWLVGVTTSESTRVAGGPSDVVRITVFRE